MKKIIGSILNIKRFEIHDGDGLRTTLFVKGCPLHCRWCHNPESISPKSELGYNAHKCIGCGSCVQVCPHGAHTIDENGHVFHRDRCLACGKCADVCMENALLFYGKQVTPEEILPQLIADKAFYQNSGGGVTISGGEPLLQSEFCAEVLRLLKEQGINTAVDTCLFASKEQLDRVIPYTDTFLVDVKAMDAELHRALTGQPNTRILENIQYLEALGKDMEVRIPYIPGQNSGEMEEIAKFLSALKHLKGVRVLPYHNLSGTKYASLDMQYPLDGTDTPIPSREEIEAACGILQQYGVKVLHK